ncbi:papilin b, proteoglycan-like sulfated glycoprotein [Thunnus maccoyii]|uniref:papilin b, proteoglycan-like sulfated glycoprotein n=1 Tax=Thunnus maccoyii TaxID=8240 RepID=UPI001C4D814E|nr:papilin b, proteoglycan-like sulfated glycoprotein [Thunnus maccoyii]
MNILQVLGLLQLLAVPAFTLTRPTHDYWGEFGPYGPCSRTCGTGVAMRTRKCITSRTDGGHNCVGSSKSFRTCNTNACPVGSRDFREEQCSQFDRTNFQSKPYTWVPYYGATNPCELNCVPRGENFFYRQRPAVVDGTPCYVGRTDICVDGACRILVHGDFMGLDDDSNSVHSAAPVVVAPHPRETLTYIYKVGVYSECSASCNGGMQYRSVECMVQDSVNPHVVEETYCITHRLQRPQSQQACNMHPCTAEYSVSSFSVCSVTCGEGQQTREVTCVGPAGERLADRACSGLARPASVQACRRPACHTHISWHVTDYGLCTRSCGGGVRERRVSCYDTDLNPYPEARCGTAGRPTAMESCNTQPCPGAQMVPSVQDPRSHESTMRGFVPYVQEAHSASRPQTNIVYDPQPSVIGPHCAQSFYGCCPDGHTSATGPRNEGCPHDDCVRTRYGCCLDGVTPAQGFGRTGCPEYQTNVQHQSSLAVQPTGSVCSLPRDDGPCDTWKVRFYYNSSTGKCTEFWFGGCQGNTNNFVSLEACQRECGGVVMEPPPPPRRVTPRRGSPRGVLRARA